MSTQLTYTLSSLSITQRTKTLNQRTQKKTKKRKRKKMSGVDDDVFDHSNDGLMGPVSEVELTERVVTAEDSQQQPQTVDDEEEEECDSHGTSNAKKKKEKRSAKMRRMFQEWWYRTRTRVPYMNWLKAGISILSVSSVFLMLYPAPSVMNGWSCMRESHLSDAGLALFYSCLAPLKHLMHLGAWFGAAQSYECNQNVLGYVITLWGLQYQLIYTLFVTLMTILSLLLPQSHGHHSGLHLSDSSILCTFLFIIALLSITGLLHWNALYDLRMHHSKVPWFIHDLRRVRNSFGGKTTHEQSELIDPSSGVYLKWSALKKKQFPHCRMILRLVRALQLWFIAYLCLSLLIRCFINKSLIRIAVSPDCQSRIDPWTLFSIFSDEMMHGVSMTFHHCWATAVVHLSIFGPHKKNNLILALMFIFVMGPLDWILLGTDVIRNGLNNVSVTQILLIIHALIYLCITWHLICLLRLSSEAKLRNNRVYPSSEIAVDLAQLKPDDHIADDNDEPKNAMNDDESMMNNNDEQSGQLRWRKRPSLMKLANRPRSETGLTVRQQLGAQLTLVGLMLHFSVSLMCLVTILHYCCDRLKNLDSSNDAMISEEDQKRPKMALLSVINEMFVFGAHLAVFASFHSVIAFHSGAYFPRHRDFMRRANWLYPLFACSQVLFIWIYSDHQRTTPFIMYFWMSVHSIYILAALMIKLGLSRMRDLNNCVLMGDSGVYLNYNPDWKDTSSESPRNKLKSYAFSLFFWMTTLYCMLGSNLLSMDIRRVNIVDACSVSQSGGCFVASLLPSIPGYDLLFHFGFLWLSFSADALYARRYDPTLDLCQFGNAVSFVIFGSYLWFMRKRFWLTPLTFAVMCFFVFGLTSLSYLLFTKHRYYVFRLRFIPD